LLNGRIKIAVTPEARGNYYHWLLDLVPRVLLLKHAAQNFSNYDALLLNGSRANYEGEILTALGVPPEKVRYVDSRERFQIASAVIPSMDINVIAPWKVYGLRDLPYSGKQNQHRPLSFRGHAPHFAGSRMKTKSQRSCGIGIFRDYQTRKSFLAGTGKLVRRRECDCRATWRGAGQHRVCEPGTHVVEISTRAGYRDWYWQLAAVAGLSYEVIEAQRSGSFSGPNENADMIVSPENLERLLESL
jgi:hypothetical protein